jgi:hypothetical protein
VYLPSSCGIAVLLKKATTPPSPLLISLFAILGQVATPDMWNPWIWASDLELPVTHSELKVKHHADLDFQLSQQKGSDLVQETIVSGVGSCLSRKPGHSLYLL